MIEYRIPSTSTTDLDGRSPIVQDYSKLVPGLFLIRNLVPDSIPDNPKHAWTLENLCSNCEQLLIKTEQDKIIDHHSVVLPEDEGTKGDNILNQRMQFFNIPLRLAIHIGYIKTTLDQAYNEEIPTEDQEIGNIEELLQNVFDDNYSSTGNGGGFSNIFDNFIINRYKKNEGIKPHLDLIDKYQDCIIGISVKGVGVLRLNKIKEEYLPIKEKGLDQKMMERVHFTNDDQDPSTTLTVKLHPGDVYILTKSARCDWVHSIDPIKCEERISITYRRLKKNIVMDECEVKDNG